MNVPDAYAIPPEQPYRLDRRADARTGYRTRSLLALPIADALGVVIGVLELSISRPRPARPGPPPTHRLRHRRRAERGAAPLHRADGRADPPKPFDAANVREVVQAALCGTGA